MYPNSVIESHQSHEQVALLPALEHHSFDPGHIELYDEASPAVKSIAIDTSELTAQETDAAAAAQSGPAASYLDNIDGQPVSPIIAFYTEAAYDDTMAALELDSSRRGLLLNMRQRKHGHSPVDSDLFTGNEVELGQWHNGDYNWRIFQGEKARQLRRVIGEMAVEDTGKEPHELPPAQVTGISLKRLAIARKLRPLDASMPGINVATHEVNAELRDLVEQRLPSITAAEIAAGDERLNNLHQA